MVAAEVPADTVTPVPSAAAGAPAWVLFTIRLALRTSTVTVSAERDSHGEVAAASGAGLDPRHIAQTFARHDVNLEFEVDGCRDQRQKGHWIVDVDRENCASCEYDVHSGSGLPSGHRECRG